MSFSLFSNKKTEIKGASLLAPEIPMVVRTMKEDIENIKQQKDKKSVPVVEKQEQKKEEPTQNTPLNQAINPFSEEAEKIFETQTGTTEKKANTPSVETVPQPKEAFFGRTLKQKNIQKSPISVVSQGKGNLFLIGSIILVTILLISGVIYYYFFVINKKAVPPIQQEAVTESIPEVIEQFPSKELLYALDKPNYISVDTEIVSPEEIQKILSTTASRIKEVGISQPVEFLVTDQNNNPLAFSRFALLLNLNFIPTVLAQIDESFSLYIYNDAGSMRTGLNLTLIMNEGTLPALAKIENTLPDTLQMLLLEPNVVVPKAIDFQSSAYTSPSSIAKEFVVRYANIDIARKISIDYAVVGNHWYIGTSRNTLLALLDMIAK